MRLTTVLQEARANAPANPQISTNEVVARYADQPNTYVNLTNTQKLGINPKSEYRTPIGIYAYPIKYVHNIIGASNSTAVLPFAGRSKYVNIFQTTGNILDVGMMTRAEEESYYVRLQTTSLISKLPDEEKKAYVMALDNLVWDGKREARVQSPGGRFWYTTMVAAEHIADMFEKTPVVVWNALLRSIGINGVVDNGFKIIHPNEPTQAVILSIRATTNNIQLDNKYSSNTRVNQVQYGKSEQDRKKRVRDNMPSPEAQRQQQQRIVDHIIRTHDTTMVEYLTGKQIRILLLQQYPSMIASLKHPTAEEQYQAMIHSGGAYMIDTTWGLIPFGSRDKSALKRAKEHFSTQ